MSVSAGRTPFRCLAIWRDDRLPPASSGREAQSILSGREGDPPVFERRPTPLGISATQSFQLQPNLPPPMMRTSFIDREER